MSENLVSLSHSKLEEQQPCRSYNLETAYNIENASGHDQDYLIFHSAFPEDRHFFN